MGDKREDYVDTAEAQEALRKTEQHLNLVLELAGITAARVDTDLRHTWVKDQGPNSISETEALGKRDDELFPPDVAEPTIELKKAVIETGKSLTRTVTFQKSTGDRVYSIRAEPMRDSEGNIEGVMQAAVDITDEQRQQEQLNVATRMLRHNLRNRVTTLLGQAEMLDEHLSKLPDDDKLTELRDVLETLDGGIQATDPDSSLKSNLNPPLVEAKQLADDLSDLSKSNVSEMSQTIRQVTNRLYDVTEKVDRFLILADSHTYYDRTAGTELRPTLEAVQKEVTQAYPDAEVNIEGDIDTTVLAPSNELRIGLLELVENAIDHNDRPDPRVEIRIRTQDADRVLVQVVDNGPGLPAHEARVIEETTEAPLEHGSGMGLWLAQWASHKNGGPLQIDATEQGGTVVSLTLATDSD